MFCARFLVADALRGVDTLRVGFTGVRDGGALVRAPARSVPRTSSAPTSA